jgi:hypothetical protein
MERACLRARFLPFCAPAAGWQKVFRIAQNVSSRPVTLQKDLFSLRPVLAFAANLKMGYRGRKPSHRRHSRGWPALVTHRQK